MTKSLERCSYGVTFTVVLLAAISYSLLRSLVVPALPTIRHQLHTSGSAVTWVTQIAAEAAILIPTASTDQPIPMHDPHLDHAELAIVAGATITDA